ncbi:hypothetical protein DA2_1177 [Desulfovibrio sp. A2]|nr:hypothetical protein DA2_1177 [Desulfovibrio sp. A2]
MRPRRSTGANPPPAMPCVIRKRADTDEPAGGQHPARARVMFSWGCTGGRHGTDAVRRGA